LEEAMNLIRGDVGTEVTLKMYREGKADSFEVTLKRAKIEIPEWN
jgi:C-terminal processing protease CtpA/Prc